MKKNNPYAVTGFINLNKKYKITVVNKAFCLFYIVRLYCKKFKSLFSNQYKWKT